MSHIIQKLDSQLARTNDPIEMAKIYQQAGLLMSEYKQIDEACFFMTQAFIFASHHGENTIVNATREFLQDHNRI